VKYIFENIKKQKAAGRKVVVVTHHAPSSLSIAPWYKDDHYINGGYHSKLENQILDTSPDLWFHGHMHNSFDYTLGDTRVICNPRGYYPEEINPDFKPGDVIEI
jgi:Icc-related predicted phosphoesterase